MHRHSGFSIQGLKVAASLLTVSLGVVAGLIFVSYCRVHPGDFSPSSLWTYFATAPILYSIPAAFLVAWGLHYWHNRHPVNLVLLGDKDDRLTPVKKK